MVGHVLTSRPAKECTDDPCDGGSWVLESPDGCYAHAWHDTLDGGRGLLPPSSRGNATSSLPAHVVVYDDSNLRVGSRKAKSAADRCSRWLATTYRAALTKTSLWVFRDFSELYARWPHLIVRAGSSVYASLADRTWLHSPAELIGGFLFQGNINHARHVGSMLLYLCVLCYCPPGSHTAWLPFVHDPTGRWRFETD
eukprot:SAG31_NODE_1780_length_7290_cov_1.784036_3_plen_197_part_00